MRPTLDDEETQDTSFMVNGRVLVLLEQTLMILVALLELPVGV